MFLLHMNIALVDLSFRSLSCLSLYDSSYVKMKELSSLNAVWRIMQELTSFEQVGFEQSFNFKS